MIHLRVREASLGQVLEVIANKSGAIIHSHLPAESPINSVECAATALYRLLDCALGGRGNVLSQLHSASGLTKSYEEFWLLNEGKLPQSVKTLQPSSPGESPDTASADQTQFVGKDDLSRIREWMDMALHGRSARDRAWAVAMLAVTDSSDDGAIRLTLESALDDDDALVRERAVSTLARREGKSLDVEVFYRALADSDSNVRLAAVNNAGHDLGILTAALNDPAPTVHTLAELRLREIAVGEGKH